MTSELTPEQQAVLDEVDAEPHMLICIPERRSSLMTDELWQKRKILKELVYKGLVNFDVDFRTSFLLFYSKKPGPLKSAELHIYDVLCSEYLEVK